MSHNVCLSGPKKCVRSTRSVCRTEPVYVRARFDFIFYLLFGSVLFLKKYSHIYHGCSDLNLRIMQAISYASMLAINGTAQLALEETQNHDAIDYMNHIFNVFCLCFMFDEVLWGRYGNVCITEVIWRHLPLTSTSLYIQISNFPFRKLFLRHRSGIDETGQYQLFFSFLKFSICSIESKIILS